MSPEMGAGTLGDKPNGSDINKSTFAPQPTGKFIHEWDRAPVASKAPRLQGKKVWKKLMRALGGGDDEKLQQAQAELETAGAGTRKKMRMTSTKTNIRDAEWEGTEWHGFADDVMAGVQTTINDNDATPTSRKRRNNDKIVTPRKPLRQTSLNQQAQTFPLKDVLEDEVTIAKRARKAMRKSGGSRMSLLLPEQGNKVAPQTEASNAIPILADATHETPAERHALPTIYVSPSKLSPNKRIRVRSKSTLQKRASMGEPRRLSGALFADASPTTTSTKIDFHASTAEGMQFGAKSPVGTPVRAVSVQGVPRTAPAKIQPTRSEIEQEMASFFTPIPRLKKIKRRSSPIKSYLQQLLENKEEVVAANQEAQDSMTPERDSALSFARDVPASPQTPVEASSPCVEEDKVEVHSSLDAVASAVRLDFNLVPDLSIEKLGSFADVESTDEETDAEEEVVSLSQDDNEKAVSSESEGEDPEEQLRAELAAAEESTPLSSPESEPVADVDATEVDNDDELMLDAPTAVIADLDIEVADASAPAFESSIEVIEENITQEIGLVEPTTAEASDSNDSAVSDNSASTDESAADNITSVSTNFDDEETAMLLAFVTKNQAKKLARTSPKARKAHAPHSPLRLPLSEVTGNTSPPDIKKTAKGSKVEKPASPVKKSRRLNPDTAIDTPADSLPENEVLEPSSAVRRSGRTVSKQSKIPAPPSFIPVRHLGADGTEVKAPKKEKTVEQVTKINTGKNKAGCLQPMVVLKRIKMEEKMTPSARQASLKEAFEEKEKRKEGAKEKKKLVWAEELTAVREFDERSIVRPVEKEKVDKRKEKAEGKKLEETRKTRVRVGTASERASKLALGMVANGTPAKRKSREVTAGDKEKKETPAKKVKQPKLRSPKVKVAAKKDEDVVMA